MCHPLPPPSFLLLHLCYLEKIYHYVTIKYKLREQEIIKNDQVELKTEFFKTENLIVELKQPMGHPCGNEHTN